MYFLEATIWDVLCSRVPPPPPQIKRNCISIVRNYAHNILKF